MKRTIVIAIFAAGLSFPALGSTADSWNELDAKAVPACAFTVAKFAETANLRVDGRILGIGGDSDQYYGLIYADDKSQRWLCLYDKKSGERTVGHIDDVSHPH